MTKGADEGDRCKAPECYGVLEAKQGRDCSCHISPPCGSCADTGLRCGTCDLTPDEAAQLAEEDAVRRGPEAQAARASFEEDHSLGARSWSRGVDRGGSIPHSYGSEGRNWVD